MKKTVKKICKKIKKTVNVLAFELTRPLTPEEEAMIVHSQHNLHFEFNKPFTSKRCKCLLYLDSEHIIPCVVCKKKKGKKSKKKVD